MSSTIKVSIRARGHSEAPTVDDLLDQLRDYFAILEGVEQAIAEDGRNAIEWRVIKATTNSPITIEATAFPRDFAVNIDRRAALVTRQTAFGLDALKRGAERPSYFTDPVLQRAEKLFARVTNGLAETRIDYGKELPSLDITFQVAKSAIANTRNVLTPKQKSYQELGSIEGNVLRIDYGKELPSLDITFQVAKSAIANTRNVLTPKQKSYQELGSIEGNVQRIERDGFGRRVMFVRYRMNGEIIKCLVSGEAEKELENHQIKDVWRFRRVQVYGMLHYRGVNDLREVEAIRIKFMPERNELPTVDEIIDPHFTGGLKSEEYLARLRDGDL